MKKTYLSRLLCVPVLTGLILAACASTPASGLREAWMTGGLIVDGSTSAHPLQRTLVCTILEVPCTWSAQTEENVQRTIIPDPAADVHAEEAQVIMNIVHNGTNGSYLNLIEDKVDFILVARQPSEDELDAARVRGVELDVQEVALDAFVFLANVHNPVESLTIEQIRLIYTGKITEWQELGVVLEVNGDGNIHAYQRERNSGSQELMKDLVMKDLSILDAPNMIVTSMVGPFNSIGGNPWTDNGDALGLGYSIYYYTTAMFPHQYVRMIPLEGVEPTPDTIRERTYPLVSEVYAVVRKDLPADASARRLMDWLLTAEGQLAVTESGYVSLPR